MKYRMNLTSEESMALTLILNNEVPTINAPDWFVVASHSLKMKARKIQMRRLDEAAAQREIDWHNGVPMA